MKKVGVLVLLLMFFCGCSDSDKQINRGMELRTKLLEASAFSFDADITADYGDKLHQFSMNCQSDREGNIYFTVTAPESISGISGRIQDEGGELIFEDVALHFELLTDNQLSPVSAPWILVKTLRSGYLTTACEEESGLRLTVDDRYDENAMTADIWLDEQNLPARAEILYDGKRILTLIIKNAVLS